MDILVTWGSKWLSFSGEQLLHEHLMRLHPQTKDITSSWCEPEPPPRCPQPLVCGRQTQKRTEDKISSVIVLIRQKMGKVENNYLEAIASVRGPHCIILLHTFKLLMPDVCISLLKNLNDAENKSQKLKLSCLIKTCRASCVSVTTDIEPSKYLPE